MELVATTLLMAKHVIADYFMQYSWMIKHKGTYGHWKGMAHSGYHGILTALVFVLFLEQANWFSILLGLLDSVIHHHVDYVKSNFWKSKKLGPSDQMYWVAHGVDQFLHFMTYVLLVILYAN